MTETFLKSILWTDESTFTREGILNFHNLHHWDTKGENPHVIRSASFQRKFSVNVWAEEEGLSYGAGKQIDQKVKMILWDAILHAVEKEFSKASAFNY
ncbi:hypothetical protein NQ318_007481 [Aromia moschata]|uniref:Uncharacterized protein n=1 Tax=Aromia moschata TaxID=1265417 RepID=A0AAV8YDU8_9CUCU|nr:hypothetical protein NQ318_007481 [Aromia moschata]